MPDVAGSCWATESAGVYVLVSGRGCGKQNVGGTTSASSDAAPPARLCRKALDASLAVSGNGTECMATRDLRTPSILLVSNSVDERKVYTRVLRASGYRVVNAATTVLAYQVAITRPTDIVVTDGHCAGSMSGLELTRRLRIHTRTDNRPHHCDNKRDEAPGW